MRRVAFLFPGQGAQEVGMGRDLFGADAFADDLAAAASAATGLDIAGLCAKGPAKALAETKVLQPALTAVCLALWKRLADAGISPVATAGHSLGELAALAASGALEPRDAVTLAASRADAMGRAASLRQGAMIAVTGPRIEEILARIEAFDGGGIVAPAAINAPDQMTVSGDRDAVEAFAASLRDLAGAKITALRVSGAWHCEHMRPAVDAFSRALEATPITAPRVPVFFNRDGDASREPEEIRGLLAGQLVRPIRWDLVMARFVDAETTDFVEIGPGKVLRGLVRLNVPGADVPVHNISDLRSLERTAVALTK